MGNTEEQELDYPFDCPYSASSVCVSLFGSAYGTTDQLFVWFISQKQNSQIFELLLLTHYWNNSVSLHDIVQP